MRRGLGGGQRFTVLDEVAQAGVLLLADRLVQRNRLLADLDDLADLLGGDDRFLALAHRLGDLLDRRLAAELSEQGATHFHEAVDRLDHVDRDADRASLIGNGARDRLPYPPRGVRGELEAFLVLELLYRPDEADVPFLDQVEERHPAAHVLAAYGDDQAQVRRGEVLASVLACPDDHTLPVAESRAGRNGGVPAHLT